MASETFTASGAAVDRLEAYRYTAAGPGGVATAILAVDDSVPEHCR